ncbi:MAG: TauD/TfdA dioxygenase family protein [Minwuia sp.]|uniref:TauD/TfdA dioxygenase family protein n=1 Tax=Minwuia sp. TaxID=2493630 RepID=UPI003A8A02FD
MSAFDIRPLTRWTGAEIFGPDLTGPIGEELAAALRDALASWQVIFLPDQHLDIPAQKRLTQVFGPLERCPYVVPMDDEPDVIAVLKEAGEVNVGVFGGDWHSDFSFLPVPPLGSVLNAVEVPPFGGDTLWANQVAALDALSADLRAEIDGRDAIHIGKPYGVSHAPKEEERSGGSIRMVRDDPQADREMPHPAIRIDPVSGKPALNFNPTYALRLSGRTEAESAPILDAIQRHTTRPEFCVRHRWRAGTVAVWNNYTTMHYAVNDYDGHRRLMYRTTFGIADDRQTSPS